jgi:hypothetical protein
MLYFDGMDPQCMIGGHDLCLQCHPFCDLSMGMPTSELIYMIFCRCLVVRRFPIRCAPGFRHTHAAYKVFRLSLIPTSYFGGHSVTHDFGHHDGVLMMVYSGSS